MTRLLRPWLLRPGWLRPGWLRPGWLCRLRSLPLLLIVVAVGAGGQRAHASGVVQALRFEVAVEPGLDLAGLSVAVDRLGVTQDVALVDDGSVAGDVAGDGIWSGVADGPYARVVGLHLAATTAQGAVLPLWAGTARSDDQRGLTIAWRAVQRDGTPVGERVAVALPAGSSALSEASPLLVSFGWGLLVLIVLTALGAWRGAASTSG